MTLTKNTQLEYNPDCTYFGKRQESKIKTKGKNATKKLTWNRKCLTARDLKENNSMTLPFSNQNLSLYKKDDISMTGKLFQLTELILRVHKDTYTGFHSMQG